MQGEDAAISSPVLNTARPAHDSLASLLEHATRALAPWPLLWTEVSTKHGKKRMQILGARPVTAGHLELTTVKLEGKTIASWEEIKNTLK
jgi:methionyl-tRNA formyltransferase